VDTVSNVPGYLRDGGAESTSLVGVVRDALPSIKVVKEKVHLRANGRGELEGGVVGQRSREHCPGLKKKTIVN